MPSASEAPVGLQLCEHAELVAAHAICVAATRDRGLEALAQACEQGVPRGVAVGVVVRLEAVEVEDDQQRRLGFAVRKAVVEVLHQPAPVGQPGQHVVVGVVRKLRLDLLLLGDVLDLDHGVQWVASRVVHKRDLHERRDDPAVGVHVALVERRRGELLADKAASGFETGSDVVGMGDLGAG
jgi:hypothetical protein